MKSFEGSPDTSGLLQVPSQRAFGDAEQPRRAPNAASLLNDVLRTFELLAAGVRSFLRGSGQPGGRRHGLRFRLGQPRFDWGRRLDRVVSLLGKFASPFFPVVKRAGQGNEQESSTVEESRQTRPAAPNGLL